MNGVNNKNFGNDAILKGLLYALIAIPAPEDYNDSRMDKRPLIKNKEENCMKCNQMPIGLKMMLEKAKDDPAAAYTAALLLEEGHRGPQAVQFFCQRSAEDGYVPAMIKLAGIYIMGHYIHDDSTDTDSDQDIKTGVDWLRRAADTGDDTANYMMAHCYCEGVGVAYSRAKAMYFVGQISAPKPPLSLYETTETLIFGSISSELRAFTLHRQRAKSLARAG